MKTYFLVLLSLLSVLVANTLYSQSVTWKDSLLQSFFSAPINKHYEALTIDCYRDIFLVEDTLKINLFQSYSTAQHKSNIGYVTLLDESLTPVKTHSYRLRNSIEPGVFIVPGGLSSGLYYLQPYTQWQLNYEYYLDNKVPIVIINPKETLTEIDKPVTVNFFPEGGQLINLISNKVTVKINGLKEYPKVAELTDQNNLVISEIKIDSEGYSQFYCFPNENQTLSVSFFADQDRYSFALPAGKRDGVTVSRDINATGSIRAALRMRKGWSKEIFLGLFTQYQLKNYALIKPTEKNDLLIDFPLNDLSAGEYLILAIDQQRNILSSHRFTYSALENLTLKSLRKEFSRREKFDISLYGNTLAGSSSSLVSTKKHYQLFEDQENNRTDGLSQHESATWKRILSNDLETDYPKEKYPELRGSISSSEMAADSVAILFSNGIPYSGKVKTGNFSVPILAFNEPQRFLLDVYNENKEILDDEVDLQMKPKLDYDKIKSSQKPNHKDIVLDNELLRKLMLKRKIQKQYAETTSEKLDYDFITTDYDITVRLKDYIALPTMEEVFRELVPEVTLRKRRNEYFLNVYAEEKRMFLDNNPLVFINEVPIKDLKILVDLNPSDVRMIGVINTNYRLQNYGDIASGGIVGIITKSGDATEFEAYDRSFIMQGYSNANFERTANEPAIGPRPDFRSYECWQVTNGIDSAMPSFQFYTSDEPGEYVIEGTVFEENNLLHKASYHYSVE